MKNLMKIIRGEAKLIDIWHYFVGKYRYVLYYSPFSFLIRKHIKEQIDFRIKVMDKVCYNQGECKLCGCQTTALQMANKTCDKPCYPEMMSRPIWKIFKESKVIVDDHTGIWQMSNGRLINHGKCGKK